MSAIDDAVAAYVECALWAEDPTPWDDDYTADDVADDALETIRREVSEMLATDAGREAIEHGWWSPEQFGHDFYLTRNRHGAGYWDRYAKGEPKECGRELTQLAHAYGEQDFTLGDDGKLHIG